jgi:hypothetical protein
VGGLHVWLTQNRGSELQRHVADLAACLVGVGEAEMTSKPSKEYVEVRYLMVRSVLTRNISTVAVELGK